MIMKKLLIILLITGCASANNPELYRKNGLPHKAHKKELRYIKILIIAGCVGYFTL